MPSRSAKAIANAPQSDKTSTRMTTNCFPHGGRLSSISEKNFNERTRISQDDERQYRNHHRDFDTKVTVLEYFRLRIILVVIVVIVPVTASLLTESIKHEPRNNVLTITIEAFDCRLGIGNCCSAFFDYDKCGISN